MEYMYKILIRFNKEIDIYQGYTEDYIDILVRAAKYLNIAYDNTQCAIVFIKRNNIVRKYRVNRTMVKYLEEFTI